MIPSLKDLQILALDCQTTGATPDNGHLLEIGWVKTRASTIEKAEDLQPEAYLIRLPEADEIPRSVKRITGITAEDLAAAHASKKIWRKIASVAQHIATFNQSATCPAVIHFSRFEEPFLRDLHAKNFPQGRFPFQVICTHEIAKRLLPGLPRKGLRAIAGYFGYPIPELKRSADHAMATALIWKELVTLLENDPNIKTIEQLLEWLHNSVPNGRPQRSYPMDSAARRRLPGQPGIYRMLRSNGEVLYIGKAKSLKQRVSSYFRQSGSSGEHILEMLTQAYKLDFTVTESALEAAILETDEIKRQSPPYNVALRRRGRKLVFCARDLKHLTHVPDESHPIGPLPSGNLNDAMTAFATLINAEIGPRHAKFEKIAYTLLGIPLEYAPEKDCIREGLEIFRQRHQNILHQRHPLRILTWLGARLWREHLERRERDETQEADIDETDEHQTEDDRHVWSPEDVAHLIESVIRRAAHLIRRSRWFCMQISCTTFEVTFL